MAWAIVIAGIAGLIVGGCVGLNVAKNYILRSLQYLHEKGYIEVTEKGNT